MYLTKQYLKNSIEKLDKIKEEGSVLDWLIEVKEVVMSDLSNNPKKHMSEPLYTWFKEEGIFLQQFEDIYGAGRKITTFPYFVCSNGMVVPPDWKPTGLGEDDCDIDCGCFVCD